jgi:hypothetical protein
VLEAAMRLFRERPVKAGAGKEHRKERAQNTRARNISRLRAG